ncbi:hypothetical protein GOODEAATRI_018625, partial [Goodea atripinnis]
LVESKLKVWIQNAFLAQTMEKDHEYVLEDHGVVLVDYSCTDVVENCMKWCDGLQQFLEMKHQSKLSDMTVIANYMSNVCLLQKYKSQIYGLSGTLGQQAEIETLRRIYEGIQTCQIPSFKRRKLFEVQGVFMKDERKWMEKICEVVAEQISPTTYRSPRAVLVNCETIKLAKVLYQIFSGRVTNTVLYVKNNRENSVLFARKLGAGDIIIATNLAGRGTDLQVSDSVKAAGGLFVVQTFLPENARVEAQAFGHAARQGSPGSAQLVVCFNHLSEPLQLLIVARNFLSIMENTLDVTYRYVTQQTTDPAGNLTTRFDKHIMARHTVLVSFKSNIYEAMQKVDRARDTGGSVRVKKTLAYFLVSLEHLLPLPVILMESARDMYSRNPLLSHQRVSHPSLDIFYELTSLESMGLTHIYDLDTPFSLVAFFSKIARPLH